MILVLVDHDRGELDQLSLRALTAARKLGQDVEAIVIGKKAQHLLASSVNTVQRSYTLQLMQT